jgi:hypothetical protein
MSTNSASGDARIFWLTLPPLDAPSRIAAARLALRDRVANPASAVLALGNAPGPHGKWCAVVGSIGASSTPRAARTPWTEGVVTWWRSATEPHLITARGESIALDPSMGDALPELLVGAAGAAGVKSVAIINDGGTPPSEPVLRQWRAELGLPIALNAAASLAPNAAWTPNFAQAVPLVLPATRALSYAYRAGWVAAGAALIHLAFAGMQWWRAEQALRKANVDQRAVATALTTTPDAWRAALRARAPTAVRDSASSALAIVTPALAPTAQKMISLTYESNTLSVEWRGLTEPERLAFVAAIEARGASVISAGQRARLVWP